MINYLCYLFRSVLKDYHYNTDYLWYVSNKSDTVLQLSDCINKNYVKNEELKFTKLLFIIIKSKII